MQSFLLVVNAPALAYQAILLALGKQELSFWINVLGFWVCGLPVGAVLTFYYDMGVAGLWWGIVVGMTVMTIINRYFAESVDFDNLEEGVASDNEGEAAALLADREESQMYTEPLKDEPERGETRGLLGGHPSAAGGA